MHQPGNSTGETLSTSETTFAGEVKKSEIQVDKIISRCHSVVLTEDEHKSSLTEAYQKQLQNLRKELNYISETDWMYEAAERRPL